MEMGWTRRLMGLVASLASLGPGAAISDEPPAEGERERPSRLESGGFAASGPGFYLWEEDSKQGRRWEADLTRWPELKDDDFG